MQFMADVHLPCEACNNQRFKEETLEVKFSDKSIADILNMTVTKPYAFLKRIRKNEL